MSKPLFQSYLAGIRDMQHGESYETIFKYFWPEFITALILSSILHLIDASFIAHIKSTSMYATLGVTSTLIHFITKIAEGLSVGTTILCGKYNGKSDYRQLGIAAKSGIALTLLMGAVISTLLFFAAPSIYGWYQVPPKMMGMGIKFLRLRSISIFLMFIFFACIGYLRGVKNTRVPMALFVMGGVVFVIADYIFIFGAFGIPSMKLYGSALASIIQYVVMLSGALWYIFVSPTTSPAYMQHAAPLPTAARSILSLSWPVMVDKAVLAGAKMWLAMLIGPMGKTALASFAVIKDMEQLAFVPAIACAQVITFLVSNDFGKGDWLAIKNNIKRIILIASVMVFSILLLFSYKPHLVIALFDTKKVFGSFAAQAFPLLSVLVFFDLLQLILAGALRGASDVKTVMMVRLITCIVIFCPSSYLLAHVPIQSQIYKFVIVYGSFYVSNGIMSLIYIQRFRGHAWKQNDNKRSDIKPSRIADDQDYQGRGSQTSKDVQHPPA